MFRTKALRGAETYVEVLRVSPLRATVMAVEALPRGHRRKRQAWAALHALARRLDEHAGVATVTLDTLGGETGMSPKTLRAGFEELESLGLLVRDPLVKKPGSDEWEARTYRLAVREGQNDPLE